MRWDSRGTIALLVSALVGIAAGVVVGLTTGSPGSSRADEPNGTPSSTTTPGPGDPLGVGVTEQDLPCTGKPILVVGYGNDALPIVNAVSANPDDVHYLDAAASCNTVYGPEGKNKEQPRYVAYLGPFKTFSEPCGLRMSIDHKGDHVTLLKYGSKVHVNCLCAFEPEDLPELTVGMVATTRTGIFVRALQQMLVDIEYNPTHHVTGYYDQATADMVEQLQRVNALNPAQYGNVKKATWLQLRDRGCVGFDF